MVNKENLDTTSQSVMKKRDTWSRFSCYNM